MPVQAPRNLAHAAALRAFRQHADETNDIFHLAAQVIARTILAAERLLSSSAAGGVLLLPTCAACRQAASYCPGGLHAGTAAPAAGGVDLMR